MPVTIGKICSDNNVQNFTYISSLGASSKKTNLYLKNKGMAEEELRKLNFKKFIVIRPSFLIGKRIEERNRYFRHEMYIANFSWRFKKI